VREHHRWLPARREDQPCTTSFPCDRPSASTARQRCSLAYPGDIAKRTDIAAGPVNSRRRRIGAGPLVRLTGGLRTHWRPYAIEVTARGSGRDATNASAIMGGHGTGQPTSTFTQTIASEGNDALPGTQRTWRLSRLSSQPPLLELLKPRTQPPHPALHLARGMTAADMAFATQPTSPSLRAQSRYSGRSPSILFAIATNETLIVANQAARPRSRRRRCSWAQPCHPDGTRG